MSFTPTVAKTFRIAEALVIAVTATAVEPPIVVIVIAMTPVETLIVVIAIATVHSTVVAVTAIPTDATVVANRAGAQDGEGAIGIPASLLHNNISVRVIGATLVDRVVVAPLSDLAPDSINRTAVVAVVAAINAAVSTKDDVAHGARRAGVLTVVAVVPSFRSSAEDLKIPVCITTRTLHDDVAISVVGTALVDGPVSILSYNAP
jgi:hypothetical protein